MSQVKQNLRTTGRIFWFKLVSLLSSLIGFFIPKNRNLWVFGAWYGKLFSDSPKYLYLHVLRIHKEIRPVWLSKDPAVIAHIKKIGGEAYHPHSFKGLAVAARAGAAFYCLSPTSDLTRYFLSRRTKMINLWHGSPLKHLSYIFPDGSYILAEEMF